MSATVAIVGRPNVGKSTLFNRLTGTRRAIVDNTPGVTRDRREGRAQLAGLNFQVVDTAGLEDTDAESLAGRMSAQTERAIADADLVLFMVDGRAGVTPIDNYFAERLRRSDKPILVLVNKCEGRDTKTGILEAYSLGLGEPIAISAEHGLGMADLVEALAEALEGKSEAEAGGLPVKAADTLGENERPLSLAIVGRPNVGKSTLVNRLIGRERMLTGPEAGITRDAISIEWTWRGRPIQLVDTAGLRRRARISDALEQMSVEDTRRAIRFAEVVVLVLDAEQMLERQDLNIANEVAEEGRALVIGVNKWDLIDDPAAALQKLRDRLRRSLPQIRGVPVVTFSALSGERLDRLMQAVFDIREIWNRRIPTAELNRWLAEVTERHPPPLAAGRRIRLRYMTQVKNRPPTFAIFVNKPADLPESYLRYLANGLREAFGLSGVPLRLLTRRGKNPYA